MTAAGNELQAKWRCRVCYTKADTTDVRCTRCGGVVFDEEDPPEPESPELPWRVWVLLAAALVGVAVWGYFQ